MRRIADFSLKPEGRKATDEACKVLLKNNQGIFITTVAGNSTINYSFDGSYQDIVNTLTNVVTETLINSGFITYIDRFYINDMDVDAQRNVYVTGYTTSTLTNIYNYESTQNNLTSTSLLQMNQGISQNAIVIKYNSSGKVDWATNIGTTLDSSAGLSVKADSQQNLYVSGWSRNIISSFNCESISSGIISTSLFGRLIGGNSNRDVYIVKYNSSGKCQWATNISGTSEDLGFGLEIDSNNDLYITGYFTGSTFINSFYSTINNSTISTSQFGMLVGLASNQECYLAKYNSSGQAQWATLIGQASGSETPTYLSIDASNNVCVVGYFTTSTFVHSYTNVTSNIISTSQFGRLLGEGSRDVFIVKYNSSGQALWASNVGGTGLDTGSNVSCDLFSNIYIVGDYITSTFINSYEAISSNIISTSRFGQLTSISTTDGFVVKYNSSGKVQWATTVGGVRNDYAYGVDCDVFSNVYVTGQFNISTLITNYESISSGIVSTSIFGRLTGNSNDGFIIKYNSSGQAQWATNIGGNQTDSGIRVKNDYLGNVYVTGNYLQSTLFNQYNTRESVIDKIDVLTTTSGEIRGDGSTDGFLARYNSSGQLSWAIKTGGVFGDLAQSVTADSKCSAYVSGYFINQSSNIYNYENISSGVISTSLYGRLRGPAGVGRDAFIVKYASTGKAEWATTYGGSGTSDDVINGIITDSQDNVYVTGYYFSSTFINNFEQISSGIVSTSRFGILSTAVSGNEAIVVKYNSSGKVQWATNIGSTNNADVGMSITADSSNNIIVGGYYTGSTIIQSYNSVLASGLISTTLYGRLSTQISNFEAFIVKYNTSGIVQWATLLGGAGTLDDQVLGITTDTSSNIYATGTFTGTLNSGIFPSIRSALNVTSGIVNTTEFGRFMGNNNSVESFLVKYNASGQVLWATSITGVAGVDNSNGVVCDSENNVYITGDCNISTNINSYEGISSGIVSTSLFGTLIGNTTQNAFIVKYNSSGKAQWASKVDGTSRGFGLTVDSNNNVYMAGSFNGSTIYSYVNVSSNIISTTQFGRIQITNPGTRDALVVKFTSSGNAEWATNISGTGIDQGNGIKADSNNFLYTAGYFTNSTIFNSFSSVRINYISSIITSTITSLSSMDSNNKAWIVKYTSSGTILL